MKSRLSGASFSRNCDFEYLLKHKVTTQVFRSSGSTSRFFDAIKRDVTAVSYRSLVGKL